MSRSSRSLRDAGATPMPEEQPPLAQAIRQAEEEALAAGLDALAVLLPDTPLVTAAALTRAVHTLGPVVLAPAADETGNEPAPAPASRRDPLELRQGLVPPAPRGGRAAGRSGGRDRTRRARVRPGPPGRYPHGRERSAGRPHARGPASARRVGACAARRRGQGRRPAMQGTIKHYDEASQDGLRGDGRSDRGRDRRSIARRRVHPDACVWDSGCVSRSRTTSGRQVARELRLVTFAGR